MTKPAPTATKPPSRLALLSRVAMTMPPRLILIKSLAYLVQQAARPLRAVFTGRRCSYPAAAQAGGVPTPRLGAIDFSAAAANADTLRALSERYLDHRFDLLGSGWVRVAHGERYAGFAGAHYGPGPALAPDWVKAVAKQLRGGNRKRARAILGLIDDPAYVPIDWHVDYRSGYRWSPAEWGRSVTYAHHPGIDVKMPWELARFQHAPVLAQAHALARSGLPGFPAPERLVAAFRNQALDFIGSNPPDWGVNWACPMDVAIRGANLLIGWDLFRAQGVEFDAAFEGELAAAALAHGRHVYRRLEWHELYRANHYLADICGLAFLGAYLPDTKESRWWLDFAEQELAAEVLRQFAPDGGCFEASVAYHRLSAEMALYTAALLTGLDRPLPDAVQARLAAAVTFAAAATLPSGRMIQIGDTDSGRFLKVAPLCDAGADGPVERVLDPGELFAAAAALFSAAPAAPPAAGFASTLVAALAGGIRLTAPPVVPPDPPVAVVTSEPGCVVRIEPPDPAALEGLVAQAFPDFGLYLWRNARAVIAVRCGPVGQNGRGGHAHNDQLAVEIEIDGVPWSRDPGSYVYTSDLAARDRYRSALAHFVPRQGAAEPARLLAPFRLEDRARAEALRFDATTFVGRHVGFGAPVFRRVTIEADAIVVEDWPAQSARHAVRSPGELAALWGMVLPFSPGYGRLET